MCTVRRHFDRHFHGLIAQSTIAQSKIVQIAIDRRLVEWRYNDVIIY